MIKSINQSILGTFLMIFLLSFSACNKDNLVAEKEQVPDGWNSVQQVIVINHQGYNITLVYNEDGSQSDFINEPKEVKEFFEKYDETFVPHAVQDDKGLVIHYYKDWEDLTANVKMISSDKNQNKAYNGGYSRSYINIYPSTNSTNFQQNLLTYKTFDFGNVSAYGQSTSNVGSTFNDKFMEIRLVRYSSSEAIHYMGCEHDNWGGRRFIYTVTGNGYDVTLPIWQLKFKRVGSKNWGGKVTSCETWQANYNVTHWNHPTVF